MGLHAVSTHVAPQATTDIRSPDAMKPFATISLHDLLVLGHRLCLNWSEVNPMGDRLTAQDDYGNDISAHRIRGLGLMVQFQHDSGRSQFGTAKGPGRSSSSEFKTEHLFVPSAEADKLAFGIIPGDTRLNLDDVLAATQEDCLNCECSDVQEGNSIHLSPRGVSHYLS